MSHKHHCKCRKDDLQGKIQKNNQKCRRPFRIDGKLGFCRPSIRFCGQTRSFDSCGTE